METILIVEDDADIVEILSLYLGGAGFELKTAGNGEEGLDVLARNNVDAVLVDIMMPKMNGYDFIKAAREFCNAPIIIISARHHSSDKMLGLDLGADGYITKPFEPMEVISHVRAALRRVALSQVDAVPTSDRTTIEVGDLAFDGDRMELTKGGVVVPLTAAEVKILFRFMRAPGRIFTKAQLYEAVTGDACLGGEESVMVHISNIRAKLDDGLPGQSKIVTVRGLGYRLEASS